MKEENDQVTALTFLTPKENTINAFARCPDATKVSEAVPLAI